MCKKQRCDSDPSKTMAEREAFQYLKRSLRIAACQLVIFFRSVKNTFVLNEVNQSHPVEFSDSRV